MKTVNADIYLIRHAQSRENSGEEYMPEFTIDDAPLSELGKKQAQALAVRFEPGDIDMIFSSTLIRTAQTMQPTARKLGKPIIMLPELMEAETLVRGTPREKVKLLIPEAVTPDEDVFLPELNLDRSRADEENAASVMLGADMERTELEDGTVRFQSGDGIVTWYADGRVNGVCPIPGETPEDRRHSRGAQVLC